MILYSDYMIIFNGGMVLTTLVYLYLYSCLYLPEEGHISGRNILGDTLLLNYIKILIVLLLVLILYSFD